MANRDCSGEFFIAEGKRFYRCSWDSAILRGMREGGVCQSCNRRIVGADDLGNMETSVITITRIGCHEFRLPDLDGAESTHYFPVWVTYHGVDGKGFSCSSVENVASFFRDRNKKLIRPDKKQAYVRVVTSKQQDFDRVVTYEPVGIK